MRHTRENSLEGWLQRQRLLGTREFFLPPEDLICLLRHVLGHPSHPILSLNRPQTGGPRLVHRIDWLGLSFRSISLRPITVN